MNKYILFIVSIILAYSCKQNGDLQFFANDTPAEKIISIKLKSDSLYSGDRLPYLIGDTIFYNMTWGVEKHYGARRIVGDSLIYINEFISKGRGPYEMNFPQMSYNKLSGIMTFFAPYNKEKKGLRISLAGDRDISNPTTWEKFEFSNFIYMGGQMIDENQCLAITPNDNNSIFSIIDFNDGSIKNLNFKYPKILDNLDPYSIAFIWMGDICKHPVKNKFLYSTSNTKYVILFDVENEDVTNVKVLSNVFLEYKVLNSDNLAFSYKKELEIGCRAYKVTDDRVYLGYNHITNSDMDEEKGFGEYPFYYFNIINVYDWDGNFINRYELDAPVLDFIVSDDDKTMYAGSTDLETGDNYILKFNLGE